MDQMVDKMVDKVVDKILEHLPDGFHRPKHTSFFMFSFHIFSSSLRAICQ